MAAGDAKRAKIVEAVCKEAPGQPTSDQWCQWVAARMTHLEKIEVVVRELEKQRVLLAKRFDAEMKSLDERIAEQYELCPHSSRTYYPDPSGNGDSSYTCDICGFEFR